MAQLKEGSIIRKPTGDEIVATLNDLSGYATYEYVNGKNTISVLDTRDEEYLPSWYMLNQGQNMVFEFKSRSSIGNPPINASSRNTFTLMLTMVPWGDHSGGYPTQITFGNTMALRRGITRTEWGSWEELPFKSDIPVNTSELINDSEFITANEIRDLEAEVGELRRIIDILIGGEGA